MHTLNAIAASSEGKDSEDVLKVLGRVADAFDHPSLHKTNKELGLYMVNVVKSGQLFTSYPSEESIRRDTTHGSYESSFDITYDEDVDLVQVGDVSIWEHATSYPYAPRRCRSHKQRHCSERINHQDGRTCDVSKMLSTSSPLDRLDRLARMELRKTGWVERVDKWTIVEMGLQGVPQQPVTPPKTPMKKGCIQAVEGQEHISSGKTVLGNDGKQALPGRREDGHGWTSGIKSGTPESMRSTMWSPSYLAELSYANKMANRTSHGGREQTRRGFGQVVRRIVKRILPPSPVSAAGYRRMRTPRSDVSAESGWTFGSGSDSSRWSGFWH